jgi:hypothetical protein
VTPPVALAGSVVWSWASWWPGDRLARQAPNLLGVTDADTAQSRSSRSRSVVWIAAAVLIVTAVCCGGGYLRLRAQSRAQDARDRDAATAALTTYLQRVQVGDYQAAYTQLCSDVLGDYTESDHESFLRSQGVHSSFKVGRPTEITGQDGTYEVFPVLLVSASGAYLSLTVEVGLQTDGAKVCDAPGWRT